jgi:RimJ/RimL family protein N-acetyltransferase
MPATPFIAPLSITLDDLTIRSYQPGDGPAIQQAVVSSYDHLKPWIGWATTEQTIEESEALCRRFYAEYLLNQDFVLGFWLNGELAGGTGYHLREGPLEWHNAEIGMWVRASYAGHGLGTRVLRALLAWGFETWGWERLSWHCDPENIASARVAEKSGMQLEGTLHANRLGSNGERRDTHVYAMLRSAWLARPR